MHAAAVSINSSIVNYGDTDIKHPVAVGRYPENPFGLYDMSGNVWEWCSDWHGNYTSGSVTDPTGAQDGYQRIVRGGSWYNSESFCHSAYRSFTAPIFRGGIGFRVVSR